MKDASPHTHPLKIEVIIKLPPMHSDTNTKEL